MHALEVYRDPALREDPSRAYPDPEPPTLVTRRRVRRLRRGRIESIHFGSLHRTLDPAGQRAFDRFSANRTVHVRAVLHDDPHPAVVCLHAWMSGHSWVDARVLETRLLYRSGLDVYLMTMPFHGRRTPRGTGFGAWFGGALFPSSSVARTAEGFRQAVRDARRVRAVALAAGSPSVGLVGMSLGGYTTALLAGLDDGWSFAVPVVPLVSMAETLWAHGEGRPERASAERRGVTKEGLEAAFSLHCPLSYALRLPFERVAIVAGRRDGICPPASVERLWRHWGRPKLVWFEGGHIVQTGRHEAMVEALEAVEASTFRVSASACHNDSQLHVRIEEGT